MKHARQGIQRHGAGWRAAVSQGRGRTPIYRHFTIDTPIEEMQEWRADEMARSRLKRKTRAFKGTFEGDAREYLRMVSALTTHAARVNDIERWIKIFGTRQRATITSSEIRGWRDLWMKQPRATGKPPYAASTINHRLRALSNLWTVLDGRRAPNPVRDVPEVTEPDPLPRSMTFETIEAIVSHLAIVSRSPKGVPRQGTQSKTLARVRVIMYTGLTNAQLALLTPADVDLERATVLVRSRAKGAGSKPQRLPLHDKAVEAFRHFAAINAWGKFSGPSLRKNFRVAARKARDAGHPVPLDVRPYDLRHSWGTKIVAQTKSLEAAKDLLCHRSTRTTRRYALGAADDLLRAHISSITVPSSKPGPAVERHIGTTSTPDRWRTLENRGADDDESNDPKSSTLAKIG